MRSRWPHLDAPRHVFLPSKRGIECVAKKMVCEFQEFVIATMQPGPLLVFPTLVTEWGKADWFKSTDASFKFSLRHFSFLKLVSEVLLVLIYW